MILPFGENLHTQNIFKNILSTYVIIYVRKLFGHTCLDFFVFQSFPTDITEVQLQSLVILHLASRLFRVHMKRHHYLAIDQSRAIDVSATLLLNNLSVVFHAGVGLFQEAVA